MGVEYIGEVLADGHLSVDPRVLGDFRPGQKLRVVVTPLGSAEQPDSVGKPGEVKQFLDFVREVSGTGGYRQREITRAFIHEQDV